MNGLFYVDVYFAINFMMDSLALLLSSHIVSYKAKLIRIIISGIIGGVYSVFEVIFPFGGIIMPVISFGMLFLMCIIVCPIKNRKRFIYFFLITLASEIFFGGVVEMIYSNVGIFSDDKRVTLSVLILSATLGYTAWNLWGRGLRRKINTGVVPVTVTFFDKSKSFYGLIDSGNILYEPETGLPVMIMKKDAALDLLGRELVDIIESGENNELVKTYRIPAKGIGGPEELKGFVPDRISVLIKSKKAKNSRMMVAIDFSEGGFAGCPCLVPLSAI